MPDVQESDSTTFAAVVALDSLAGHSTFDEWWNAAVKLPDTQVGELVAGFDAIAAQPIPYNRILGRARTFYGDDFSIWSDLANETISSLINRPKGGEGTVRAILAQAQEAVAMARSGAAAGGSDTATAAGQLLDRLTDRDRVLLSARGWALRPEGSRRTASRIGIAAASVLRNQPRAMARLMDLLADPAHHDVVDVAEKLGNQLGTLTREHTARQALTQLGLDLDSEAGQLMLFVAGPYSWREGWLESATTAGLRTACNTLDELFAQLGAPSNDDLTRAVGLTGVAPETMMDFIESRPGLRGFGDRWVQWGTSAADKAEAVLHLSGAPATANLITLAIGEGYHPRAVLETLYADDRFIRATKETWALAKWGLDGYEGIFSEIAKRIDAASGAIGVGAIFRDLKAAFPDVADSSITTYLGAPGFIVEHGMVRRRTEADGLPAVAPLRTVRGVFRNGRNEIRVTLSVTHDMLRGSGRRIHPSVATALGVNPGHQKTFTGPVGDMTLTWRLSGTNGGTVGSLRAVTTALRAQLGDSLVLAFNVAHGTVTAARIRPDEGLDRRLRVLLGKPVKDPTAALARGLGCRVDEVAGLLRRRGETGLLGSGGEQNDIDGPKD